MKEISETLITINMLEIAGLIFGLICVWLLIKENIWTWPTGIVYVLISLLIFYHEKLYADLALHFIYLGLNFYGWYYWIYGKKKNEEDLPVTNASYSLLFNLLISSTILIFLTGYILNNFTDASLPYWDSTTTVLSLAGMYLTARKKIENWYFWFVVDVIATGIYFYKGITFYAILYLIYIGLAVAGYFSWKKSLQVSLA
jgi:nicotinamide mononucleotide transporter